MMAKKNVFGIIKGRDPKTGEEIRNKIIEATWDIAKDYVIGVHGAIYKGFTKKEEAESYIKADGSTATKEDVSPTSISHKQDVLYCYVDGSYNGNIPNYGYGLVCVKDRKVIKVDYGVGANEKAIEMLQVGGELLGAMQALLYAKYHKHSKVVIYHDYLGVGHHATGVWKRKTEFSKVYYEWMQRFFKNNPEIEVDFKKVDAHTGDDFNELADGFAKISVGIKPNPIFFQMVEKHNVSRTK